LFCQRHHTLTLVLSHNLADGGGETLVADVLELLTTLHLQPCIQPRWSREEYGHLYGQLVVDNLPACLKRALLELTLALQLQGVISFNGGQQSHDECSEQDQFSHYLVLLVTMRLWRVT
jgi:hypothetical protein